MLKVKLEGHSYNKFQTFIRSKFEYMKRIKNRLMRQKGPVIATAFQRPAKSFSEKHPGQLESIKREMDLVKKFYILSTKKVLEHPVLLLKGSHIL